MDRPVVFLIGVAHVFDMKASVENFIISTGPSVVCVELDGPRYYALTHPEDMENAKRDLPFIYRKLAKIQESLGDVYGVRAGEEMLAAANTARKISVPLLLVDDDVSLIFKRMLKEMKWMEKLRFFSALFLPSRKKTSVEKEMKRYQEDESTYIEELGVLFPTIKRLLIDERNEHMARRIASAAERYGRVAAVLGDAHLDGIAETLKKDGLNVETVHLKDLKKMHSVTIRYSFNG